MLTNFDRASVETSHLSDIKAFGCLLQLMVQQCSDIDCQVGLPTVSSAQVSRFNLFMRLSLTGQRDVSTTYT